MLKLYCLTVFLPLLASSLLVCPEGFTMMSENKCAMLGKKLLTHRDAETECRLHGGTLYSVDNIIVSSKK